MKNIKTINEYYDDNESVAQMGVSGDNHGHEGENDEESFDDGIFDDIEADLDTMPTDEAADFVNKISRWCKIKFEKFGKAEDGEEEE